MAAAVDIVTPACVRPEVFETTMISFYTKLFQPAGPNIRIRHIINIDPVGCPKEDIEANIRRMEHIVRHFNSILPSPRGVQIHVAQSGNFPRAFRWLWDHTNADYVFHLEDDWELLNTISLHNMLRIMRKYPDLAVLRLSAFTSEKEAEKNWNLWLPWNGIFFEMPEDKRHLGLAGHPSLIRGEFVRAIRPLLDGKSNPEKQIHSIIRSNDSIGTALRNFRYGVYHKQCSGPDIQDIGRHWMKEAGYKKSGAKAVFTHWEKE